MVSDVAISKRGRGGFIILPYVISSLSLRTSNYLYLFDSISTKTSSAALSYLSMITNKIVEIIAMKIFRFVEVATGGFFKGFIRGTRSFT